MIRESRKGVRTESGSQIPTAVQSTGTTTTTTTLTHVDSLLDRNGRTSQGDNDGGGSGGRLQQDSGKDTNHQTGNGIGFIAKQFSSLAPTHDLGSTSEKLQPKQEKVEEEDNGTDANKNPAPLFLCVHAARVADFGPGRLTILLFDLKVGVTKVDRVGGTILARTGQVFLRELVVDLLDLVVGHVFACSILWVDDGRKDTGVSVAASQSLGSGSPATTRRCLHRERFGALVITHHDALSNLFRRRSNDCLA